MAAVLPWHFGALHPVEQGLAIALAFGPFLVLAVVIAVRRRRDLAESDEGADAGPD